MLLSQELKKGMAVTALWKADRRFYRAHITELMADTSKLKQ
jgi:hypothetical protein